jgi:poly(A) polymerase
VSVAIQPPALPGVEPVFEAARQAAAARECRALVVGGYVRDRLLGGERERELHEVDILVTQGQALAVAEDVAVRLGLRAPVVFPRFGTAHLPADAWTVEFVSTRSERYDPSSRKPDVRPGTLEEDVSRRDFTVNALLMDWDGTVLDPTGRGLLDLKERRIMTPLDPELTLDEDPLRMLRAVRFAATLEFSVDESVRRAIRRHNARLAPPVVSMERIQEEMRKLLHARRLMPGLELLDQCGLLSRVLPELEAGRGMEQGGWHSHDVLGHNLLTAALAPPELITRLAGLLHDVGKPATRELRDGRITFIGHQEVGAQMAAQALERLRFPGHVIDAVVRLIRLHMRPISYDPATWEDRAVRRLVRDAGPQLQGLLELARADMRASHYPDVDKIDHLESRIRELDAAAISRLSSPLTGEDLMARTGRAPGPWIRRAKAALEDALVDGVIPPAKEAAWRFLEEHPELLRE